MFLACIPAAATVVALAAPGAANAALLEKCAGEGITGQGSTLQELAQKKLWDTEAATATDFNGSASPFACNGSQGSGGKPSVKYTGTGSGPGMESWYKKEEFGPTNAFIGTDQPPDQATTEKIEALGAAETLLTIPTLQAAVAIIAHLPAGCTVTGAGNTTGRLELTNKELEEIFSGEVLPKKGKTVVPFDKWSQLGTQNALSGSGCNPEAVFKRVVRLEGSGTTATLEKYLDLINKTAVVEPGKKTWKILGEELENTTWPNQATDPVITGKGSGGLITEVVAHESTVGYVNLANARGNAALVEKGTGGLGTGGKGTATFWADIQNNGVGAKAKYADPATNGDVEAKANANCKETLYTNGKVKFPPASTTEPWNEVTTKTTEKFYPICGFTYDLSLSNFEAYKGHGATQGEATTAANYLTWVTNDEATGGQPLLEGNDYLPLPSAKAPKPSVLKIAQEGAALINW
jgi:ABC-type phosphate transport system substrate-binding protein